MTTQPAAPPEPAIVVIDEAQLLIGGTSNSGKTLPSDLMDAMRRHTATNTKES